MIHIDERLLLKKTRGPCRTQAPAQKDKGLVEVLVAPLFAVAVQFHVPYGKARQGEPVVLSAPKFNLLSKNFRVDVPLRYGGPAAPRTTRNHLQQ